MDPFLRRLATLRSDQKAAAVHFGVMPPESVQLAAVQEPPPPVAQPVLQPVSPPASAPVRLAEIAPPVVAVSAPPAAPEPATGATPVPAPAPIRVAAIEPRADRLADIESVLVALPEEPVTAVKIAPPPRPRPIVERSPARRTAAAASPEEETKAPATTRPTRLAQADPRARGRLAAGRDEEDEPKTAAKGKKGARSDKDEAESRAVAPGRTRIWVQLAGGARAERMPIEFARIRAKKPSLFARRTAHVAELKGWSRLLVGPFKSDEEAQDFVNDLHKADLEGFAWTSPASQKIEKLASR